MKIKKVIAMGLATIMAVSAMSISVFAAEEKLPTIDEVDISMASEDNPVKYVTADGIRVTVFDPNISVDFVEQDLSAATDSTSSTIYIASASSTSVGNKTPNYYFGANKIVKFGLTAWSGGPYYNVALYTSSGSVLYIAEDVPSSAEATLSSTPSSGYYYFCVSTYYNPGNATYYWYTV